MNNYPCDIRSYDHDPRSPFYDSSREDAEERALETAADDCPALFVQCERLGMELEVSIEADADEDGRRSVTVFRLAGQTVDETDFAELAVDLATLKSGEDYL